MRQQGQHPATFLARQCESHPDCRATRGRDPYPGFDAGRFATDHQGWHSDHPFLHDAIIDARPRVIVEVGVWKGGSSIFMAEAIRELGLDAAVIAIDTWLGSWEHYEHEQFYGDLHLQNGYPTFYYTFLTNVLDRKVDDIVLPLPLNSASAAFVMKRRNIRPNIVHIDAGHDYKAVRSDLETWWEILRPGGIFIADDYDTSGEIWPSVRDAVDDFLKATAHHDFSAVPYKARFTKPVERLSG